MGTESISELFLWSINTVSGNQSITMHEMGVKQEIEDRGNKTEPGTPAKAGSLGFEEPRMLSEWRKP